MAVSTPPKVDYLSRDYDGLRTSMLEYAAQTFPEWTPSSEGDFGMVMVELMAYMGDILSYYTDRAQFENYLPTATQRDSILNLAFMLGYAPNSGTPATGTVSLTTDKGTTSESRRTVPAGTQITTNRVEALDGPVVFEVIDEVVLPTNPDGDAVAEIVPVQEGTTVEFQYLGESTGLPSQVMLLPNTGVYQGTIQIYVEDANGDVLVNEGAANEVAVTEWAKLDHLLEGDGTDKVFESQFSSTSTSIYFGDDINGAIPYTGLKVYATYRYGVGAAGNVGAGTVRLLNTNGLAALGNVKVATDSNGAYLSSEMTGGADPESNDSIRVNAPRVYRTQDRLVTERDFEEAALGVEGVLTANAVVGTFTSVTLFITGADGGAPSDELKQAVADAVYGKTLAGVTVSIGTPEFVSINFGSSTSPIRIAVRKGYSLKHVSTAAKRAIRKMVAQKSFGDSLSVSQVYQRLNNIAGVVTVDIDVMARSTATQSGTARITPKPWELLTAGSIYLDVVRYVKQKKDESE